MRYGISVAGTEGDDSLAEAFWAVARELRHRSSEALAPWDIAPSHSRALGVVARHGTLRLGDLAEHLRIAPRSTTEVVDALEHRGLVERLPDPDDRRATLVQLTEHGQEVVAAIRTARSEQTDAFFATLSPTDRDRLRAILRKLHG